MAATDRDTTAGENFRYGWTAVTGGWFGFFLLWTFFILGWGQGNIAVSGALVSALIATIPAAVLGHAVWKLTGRVPLHQTSPGRLTIIHGAALVAFAVMWTVIGPVLSVLIDGGSLAEMEWDAQTYVWRLFMGVLLYAIVSGISYTARVSRRLREQQRVAARAEALAAEANLAAMRSQLQPHFLFNALHSISSLIETDPEAAGDAMELLGDLLRYTIRERKADRVALSEEWQFVSDYVALQRLRFGERVAVTMEISPGADQMRVPPFVLQPLVENAFAHGMDEATHGGRIDISAHTKGSRLVLTVADNGSGITSGGSARNGGGENQQTNGTGLSNLRQRLASVYGDAAQVIVASDRGRGTSARVEIEEPT